jgi:hypothetical protein
VKRLHYDVNVIARVARASDVVVRVAVRDDARGDEALEACDASLEIVELGGRGGTERRLELGE